MIMAASPTANFVHGKADVILSAGRITLLPIFKTPINATASARANAFRPTPPNCGDWPTVFPNPAASWKTPSGKRLSELVDSLLKNGAEDDLNAALDRLFERTPSAHDELADMIESRAESSWLDFKGQDFDVLLFAAPMLAWSRFLIPAGRCRRARSRRWACISARSLRADARRAGRLPVQPGPVAAQLCDTWQLTQRSAGAAGGDNSRSRDAAGNQPLPVRRRYLVGTVAVPRGKPLFRWNEMDGSRNGAGMECSSRAAPTSNRCSPAAPCRPCCPTPTTVPAGTPTASHDLFDAGLGRLSARHARAEPGRDSCRHRPLLRSTDGRIPHQPRPQG